MKRGFQKGLLNAILRSVKSVKRDSKVCKGSIKRDSKPILRSIKRDSMAVTVYVSVLYLSIRFGLSDAFRSTYMGLLGKRDCMALTVPISVLYHSIRFGGCDPLESTYVYLILYVCLLCLLS